VRALERVGFEVITQQGSHIKLRRRFPFSQVIVPNHREIKPGTLKSILRMAGLTVDEFVGLL
jgi:predicted RNA binding protein YcfA (HicA-like mRNA interferase family)